MTTRRDITANDGTAIPVWVSGTGRPLLIVHGGTANHEAWEPVREHLDGRVQVALMDRRAGIEDPLMPLEMEKEIADVATIAESLGGDVDLLGHSSGAIPVLGAAIRSPRVRRLVLYEGGLFPDEFRAHLTVVAAKMQEPLHKGDTERLYDIFRREVVGPMYPDDEAWESVRDKLVPFALSLPREGEAIGRMQFAPETLRGLQAPTLFLAGAKTPGETVRGLADPLREMIPNFTVRELPGQEHLANWTAPELVANVVLEFLD